MNAQALDCSLTNLARRLLEAFLYIHLSDHAIDSLRATAIQSN
jgi:hypothetical protein